LITKIGNYSLWYIAALVGKRANKFYTTQKHREPQPIGRTAHFLGHGQLFVIKMKISRQLLWRGRSCEAPEGIPLLSGQKRRRHIVRNSKVLRHVSAAQKTKDKSFAKHMCGTNHFSNKIRTLTEVAA
jgi:hypothetical protein